jgi:hypothetical protein
MLYSTLYIVHLIDLYIYLGRTLKLQEILLVYINNRHVQATRRNVLLNSDKYICTGLCRN